MTPETPPCRLFVLLARAAPVGVIFRRGPTRWVELIRWDTEADTFERGQWFHGRIYERRSDLSPDGSLLIYFAAKYGRRQWESDYRDTWTAISKPPWLTALALWPLGGTYGGGGIFVNEQTIVPEFGLDLEPHPNHRPTGVRLIADVDPHGHGGSIFDRRLRRDGWIVKQEYSIIRSPDVTHKALRVWQSSTVVPKILEKAHPGASWKLVLNAGHDEDKSGDYTIVDESRGVAISLQSVTWADWDRNGRLVFARDGKLFAAGLPSDNHLHPEQLADFSGDTFEQRIAPEWAQRW